MRIDAGLVAIERGPFVYCVEGIDLGGSIDSVRVTPTAEFVVNRRNDLLGGVDAIEWDGFTAVPYYSWSNRGIGPMAVWLQGTPWRHGLPRPSFCNPNSGATALGVLRPVAVCTFQSMGTRRALARSDPGHGSLQRLEQNR